MEKFNKTLIKGSFILLIAFGAFNFFHFLYQVFMARLLSVEDYSILAVLVAIIYIFTIFTESIQIIITKYATKENDKGKLKNIYEKSTRRGAKISLILFILYLIISIPLSFILKINYLLLSFNGLIIFFAFLLPISRGIMQGKERFSHLGINMIIESSIKLVIGILFVYLGFRVYGAVGGMIIGSAFAFLFSLFSIKDIRKFKEKKAETVGINDYAISTFLITTIIVIFYSLDVIFA